MRIASIQARFFVMVGEFKYKLCWGNDMSVDVVAARDIPHGSHQISEHFVKHEYGMCRSRSGSRRRRRN